MDDDALRFVGAAPDDVAPRLDAGVVHLWRMAYDRSLGRRPLIAMLAAYLGVPASAVALGEGAKGKPRLQPIARRGGRTRAPETGAAAPDGGADPTAAPPDDATLAFNWSHSGDYALLALARGTALGVDIEQLRARPRALDIARRFFDPAEASALATLDPAARASAFIGLWCAKEAVLKAAGEGLSFGLARLAFRPRAGAGWSLARIDPALGEPATWQLAGFEAVAGYRGALAWRGGPRRILAFERVGSRAAA